MDIIGCCFKKLLISTNSTWLEFVISTERGLEALKPFCS